jgi:hypothetical protein
MNADTPQSDLQFIEYVAGRLYDTYSKSVGGRAFNNDLLPEWKEFRNDTTKKKQSDAWMDVSQTALSILRPGHHNSKSSKMV